MWPCLFVFRNSLNYTLVELPSALSDLELIVCADVEFDNLSVRLIGYYRSGGYDDSAIDYMLTLSLIHI